MKVNVIFFGKLAEIAGTSSTVQGVETSDVLQQQLHLKYPALSKEKYMIAVDKKMIKENTVLADNCTVALMPPFSGG
jgi:molybdopterin converting factor small subunit